MTPHRLLAVALLSTATLMPAAPAGNAQNFELVQPQEQKSVDLVVGTGQLIRVDQEFSSLFVANPDVADIEVKSPRLMYLTGVGVGETTLFAVDENDNVLMSTKIRVTHNLEALRSGIAKVAPGQKVSVATVDQSLVLTGEVANADQATNVLQVATQFVDDPARVVNRMTVSAPNQVNLAVRIAEVARNVDRQLGIRWSASSGFGNGGRIGVIGGSSATGSNDGSYSVGLGISRGSFSIDVLLQALSEEGLVTIMAEPNLTARSGEPARFLAGGEYPYAVVNDDENTIQFKDYGIGLSFTPTVMDNNQISLKVATEVSELDFAKNPDMPSLNTRRAETTVDLASGQSFAIAGLMQNSSSQSIARMPGMGNVPVLGALFRSNAFKRGQSELVIIVTPVVVKPTTGRGIAAPTDQFVPPNDFERILMGRFQGSRQQPVKNPIGNRRLIGPSGFVFQ